MMNIKRIFIIGEEWLYLKIYLGVKISDKFLSKTIYSLIKKIQKKSLIKSFFFIRYQDPRYHIRLRLKISDGDSFNEILQIISEHFSYYVKNGIISRIESSTYNREVERYGKCYIENIENIFYIDSQSIISMLRKIPNERSKLQLSVLIVNQYMSFFSMNLEQKCSFTKMIAQSFQDEFQMTSSVFTKQLNDLYRSNRKNIDELILENKSIYSSIFKMRLKKMRSEIVMIQLDLQKKKSNINEQELICSIIHMSLDRLFYINNRLNEFITYYLLSKTYSSILAKKLLYESRNSK